MAALLYQWAKKNSVLLVNSVSLVGTTGVTSALGFAYWWLAARQFSPEAVGLASAAISGMMLLGSLGVLGLGTLLIGELPRQQGKEAALISATLIVVGVVGGCLGIIFAVGAPYLSSDFQVLRANMENVMLFAIGVSLTSITLVLDQALIGLLRSELQLWRNALFAGVKLLALFIASLWLSHTMGLTIYATWIIGNAFSLAALAGYVLMKRVSRNYLPQWGLLRKLGPTALKHHALNLTLEAPVLILPILVTGTTFGHDQCLVLCLLELIKYCQYRYSYLYDDTLCRKFCTARRTREQVAADIKPLIINNCFCKLCIAAWGQTGIGSVWS